MLVLLLASLACRAAEQLIFGSPSISPTVTALASPRPSAAATLPSTVTPQASFEETCPNGDCIEGCLNNLGLELVNESEYSHRDPDFQGKSGQVLVNYPIQGEQLGQAEMMSVYPRFKSYQDDSPLHQRIWDYYRSIIPANQRLTLTDFIIFTDGKSNILAYVAQSEAVPANWVLSVDVVDAETPQDLTYTLVHEFAHLLTLGPSQVTPSQAIFDNPNDDEIWQAEYEACQAYFPGEGCSNKGAYIDAFFTDFWDELFEEWLIINDEPDEERYFELLDEFYALYQDRFVTDYAVTNPEEDIAESFTYFVFSPKPKETSIRDQKILFFYAYPELINLRQSILQGACPTVQ